MASIIVTSGVNAGDYFPLGVRTNVVGRDEGLPIQIRDEHVSRKHLRIRYDHDKDQYLADDMKSRHGVFINGRRISQETPLAENDVIDVGGSTLLFTRQDFPDKESALAHRKKAGERYRGTMLQ
jgi:pSer/pThr/pTyr-binding forkhead associated (FHA) protein